jgi:hypothetical protein
VPAARAPSHRSPDAALPLDCVGTARPPKWAADLVVLLAEDVVLTMPPIPLEYQGRKLVARFLEAAVFRPGITFRLVAAGANGQPAFGMYIRDPRSMSAQANGVMVFALAGGQISAMTRFDTSVLPLFGLPPALAG